MRFICSQSASREGATRSADGRGPLIATQSAAIRVKMSIAFSGRRRASTFRDRERPGDWRVEKLDEDGESIEIATFSGGDARQRAIRYADREYGAFDEIELEPYARLGTLSGGEQ